MKNFEYFAPTSVSEAVDQLQQHAGHVKILAGGTDLFLRMRHRALTPDVIIDIKRIEALSTLQYSPDQGLQIGAAVTHSSIAGHADCQQHYGALATAASWVGSRQTRNRGTVVGNLCNASPAADTAPALFAYNAKVNIAGPNGTRDIDIAAFCQGPGQTALDTAEMVTGLTLPPVPGDHGWGFLRRTRTAIDIALVSSCAVISSANGVCEDVRIGLGAVAPTPVRAPQAEAILRGQHPTADLIATTSQTAAAECSPISDVRCSGDYRKSMVEVLTRRCVQSALTMLNLL